VPCHLGESCKRKSQCKINYPNKISAFAGMTAKTKAVRFGFKRGG
jgi:hypothetical protein